MSEPLVFLRGQVLSQSQAHLTLHDAGFVMGATVTDLCRTFRQRLYLWPEHLQRFRQSCRLAEIEVAHDDVDIARRAHELVEHNARLLAPGQELALVLFATPGPIGYYLGEPGAAGQVPPTFGMHTFPLPFERYRALLERGASLVVPTVRHVPAACVDPRIKMRSRMHWWLADRAAQHVRPGSIALLLNDSGHVTETAGANFLAVMNGRVATAPRGQVLEGVSLGVVRDLCAELGIDFQERPLTVDECLNADEALLTSTPYCVAGVAAINEARFPCPGPVTRRLLQAWNEKLGLDIWAQIQAPSAR